MESLTGLLYAIMGAASVSLGNHLVPLVKGAIRRRRFRENETQRLRRYLRTALVILYRARRVAVDKGATVEELGEIPEELEKWEENG